MNRLLQIILLLLSIVNAENPCESITRYQADVIDAVQSFRSNGYSSDNESGEGEMVNSKHPAFLLPPRADDKKKTLVLEIDETMVYAGSQKDRDYQHDFQFVQTSTLGSNLLHRWMTGLLSGKRKPVVVRVKKRPELEHFLRSAAKDFELIVFTAAKKRYADPILNHLDPKNTLFTHRLYRDSCTKLNGKLVKDPYRLGRPMESVLMLDNNIDALELAPKNSIAIRSYYGVDHDDELGVSLLNLLKEFKNYKGDIREWTSTSNEIEERFLEAMCEKKCKQAMKKEEKRKEVSLEE
jgi:RNA polymerase II subunit A small phosphatase-like protein